MKDEKAGEDAPGGCAGKATIDLLFDLSFHRRTVNTCM
jgi:hypothetical protein